MSARSTRHAAHEAVDGQFLFMLYDTYGFPLDLAQEVFQDAGWSVPPESLDVTRTEMEAQRVRARAGGVVRNRRRMRRAGDGVPIYQQLSTELAKPSLPGLRRSWPRPRRSWPLVDEGRRRREASAGETVEVILDRTPAYAESGGQMGDTGLIAGREGQGRIEDTYYRGAQLIVHRVRVTEGVLAEGDEVAVSVESRRRQGLRQHHTGTHLLHAALRRGARHPRGPGRLARGARPSALRFLARRRPEGQRGRASGTARQRAGAGQCRREPVRDGSAGRAQDAAPWRCSARSTATASG